VSELIDKIRRSVIGAGRLIETPFGHKPLVYADYTASGRALSFIEDYIRDEVLPWYANTHTETSFTGAQTTALREQAREEIRTSVNGRSDDQVIFCGPGATAAINKMIDILGLRLPHDLDERYGFQQQICAEQRPVVFIGPYEHHSNELPWRESIADVVSIPLTGSGQLCMQTLKEQISLYAHRPLKIGSFSAASNVTGIKSDVQAVTRLLKQHGALSFWDYAAAAPYVGIDMNGDTPIDAVFISTHKFVGGPGTPGVLVAKKDILTNSVPAVVGGGTVMYVTPEDHRYIADHERREEGGTPAIVESIRAGLVFKLQREVGTDEIEHRECDYVERALAFLGNCPNIEILGGAEVPRLSILSLRFKHGEKDLHYGFVVSLLNDLFGIQVRGGCSCAGPYGHSLLDMDMDYSRAIEEEIQKGLMVLRPGWVRLNFNYFIDEREFEYLLQALALVAQLGSKLLPWYHFDADAGVWRYQREGMTLPASLAAFSFGSLQTRQADSSPEVDFGVILREAREELQREDRHGETAALELPASAETLRWFVLPQEVELRQAQQDDRAFAAPGRQLTPEQALSAS
jgi:selenocysteine lyase/cysteine desulfurase